MENNNYKKLSTNAKQPIDHMSLEGLFSSFLRTSGAFFNKIELINIKITSDFEKTKKFGFQLLTKILIV